MKPLSTSITGSPKWSVLRGSSFVREEIHPGVHRIVASAWPVRGPERNRIARLIAAAPDLLAALRHAYSRLNAIPHNYAKTDFRLIEDALAKAPKARRA